MQQQHRKPPTSEYCPNCGSDNREYWAGGKPPPFCMTCRFPLLLIAGKYRLVRELNEGGCGTVYEARHTQLSRDPKRAIKIIKPELMKREGMKTRFRREVQVTGSLSQQNQHIVRIYDDFGEEPGLGYFYIMEFLEGDSIDELLRKQGNKLPLSLAYSLFEQLCDAIQDAHAENIIHRDLKPENLFVVPKRRDPHFLKVIDFGIAKPVGSDQEVTKLTGGALGTPSYMSPEQCTNSNIDARTDIYAMGCILFELLTGFPPFSSQTMGGQEPNLLTILTYHMSSPPPHLHDHLPIEKQVPAAMADVIAKAMAKDPDDRYSSVESLERAFLNAKNNEGANIASPGFVEDEKDDDDDDGTFVRMSAFMELAEPPLEAKKSQPTLAYDNALPTAGVESAPLPASLVQGLQGDTYTRQAAPTSSDTFIEEGEPKNKRALTWLLAVLLPTLLAIIWWAVQAPPGQTSPQPTRAKVGVTQLPAPLRPAVVTVRTPTRPAPRKPLAIKPLAIKPLAIKPLPLRHAPRPVRARQRTQPQPRRARAMPRLRAHTFRQVRPRPAVGRQIGLCPNRPGTYWVQVFVRPPNRGAVKFRWHKGTGRTIRRSWGFCIGADSRAAQLSIVQRDHYACYASIWGKARTTYKLRMISTDDLAPSATGIDYGCLK